MADETPEFIAPEAPDLDDVTMMRAYGKLPLLEDARDRLMVIASKYGQKAASFIADTIDAAPDEGVRVFTTLAGGVPEYTWGSLGDMRVRQADENETIGGLLWPLDNGYWQYVHLMPAGMVRTEIKGGPIPAAPALVFISPEAPDLDEQGLILAYADLPRLADVREHVIAAASLYGHDVANALNEAIGEVTRNASGVRVFNTLDNAPAFTPQSPSEWPRLNTTWADTHAHNGAVEHEALAGLLWPLLSGQWQYVQLMTNGTHRSEVVIARGIGKADQ
jgi:hypothetical protein